MLSVGESDFRRAARVGDGGHVPPGSTPGRGLRPGRRIGASLRVLVIDDDRVFLGAATRALTEGTPPFEVQTAETGAAAIEVLSRAKLRGEEGPDLVLLDYHLPDTIAPALLRRLSADGFLERVPVLVLTRDERERARADALAAGAHAFSAKPSRVRALREIVIRFWEAHGSSTDDPVD